MAVTGDLKQIPRRTPTCQALGLPSPSSTDGEKEQPVSVSSREEEGARPTARSVVTVPSSGEEDGSCPLIRLFEFIQVTCASRHTAPAPVQKRKLLLAKKSHSMQEVKKFHVGMSTSLDACSLRCINFV